MHRATDSDTGSINYEWLLVATSISTASRCSCIAHGFGGPWVHHLEKGVSHCNYVPPLRTSESGIWSRREGFRCFWWAHTITRERRKVELNVRISTSRLPGAGVLDADDMQANGLDSLGGGSRRPDQSAVETLSKY